MDLGLEQPLPTHVTPFGCDVLFYEIRDRLQPKNEQGQWEYGTPHPDSNRWPHHELTKVTPAKDPGQQVWWYAAKREKQDEYNFEFRSGSPDFKFDTVDRLYVLKREEWNPLLPVYASAMPDVPAGKFQTGFILFATNEERSPVEELDSLYVFVRRTYVRRVSITTVELDIQTSRSKDSLTVIYARGEVVKDGAKIEDIVANRNHPLRGLQPDGSFHEIEQLSENFFSVSVSYVVPEGTIVPPDGSGGGGTLNPPPIEVVERPVPKADDYIVHFKAAFLEIPYQTPHPNRPGFFLTLITPADDTGYLYNYYFAKDFHDQDDYNFEISSGDVLTRAYIIPRGAYVAGTALPALTVGDYPLYPKDSDIPPGQTRPALFQRYGFTHEYPGRADKELDSFFIVVIRVYQKIRTVKTGPNDDIDRDVEVVTEFIPKGSNTLNSVPAREVVIDDSHTQYDVRTTSRIVPKFGDESLDGILQFPVELTTLNGDAPYDLPRYLREFNWIARFAIAVSAGAPPAFSQDFAPDYDMVDPKPGPFPSRTLRIMTNNPESIRALYPLSPKAVPLRETIFVGSEYFIAHQEQNQAEARIHPIELPPCIHPEIRLYPPDSPGIILHTEKLEATPGFTTFQGLGILTVGAQTLQGPFGTYIVEIIQVNVSGAYSGAVFEWGAGTVTDGASGTTGQIPPVIVSVEASADNTLATGEATPNSVVRIYSLPNTEEGRMQAGPDGLFSVQLNNVRKNPVTLYATARRGSMLSDAISFVTNDLAPDIPAASLSPNSSVDPPYNPLSYLSGTTEPGAKVAIALDPVPQKIRLTVTGSVTTAGPVKITVAAAALGSLSPIERIVNVLNTESASQVAGRLEASLLESDAIISAFSVVRSGAVLDLLRKTSEMNDSTMLASTNGGTTGIGNSTSTIITVGRGSVEVTANSAGFFSYIFSPALSEGNNIFITATDPGGVSPTLHLVASADAPGPPEYSRFPNASDDGVDIYDKIIGNAFPPSTVVVARYNSQVIGTSAPSDGSSGYEINLARSYVSGESIELYSHVDGAPEKKSPTINISAHNLNLPVPVLNEQDTLIFGTLPASALAIAPLADIKVVVRYEANPGTEHEIAIFANRNWNFNLLSTMGLVAPPQNGQRFEIFYRFPQADGKVALKAYPRVELPMPGFAWASPIFVATAINQKPSFQCVKSTSIAWSDAWTSQHEGFLVRWFGTDDPSLLRPQVTPTFGLPTSRQGSGSSGDSYLYPGLNGVVLAARAPYMGPGTIVRLDFPGSSRAPMEIVWATAPNVERPAFTNINSTTGDPRPPARAANIGEFVTIPVANWTNPNVTPAWGDGKPSDPYMTLANLKLVIPPVMSIYVEAPDGRTIQVNQSRTAASPFIP